MTVSFASAAKAEVCKNIPSRRCCALAECFGILLYCNSFQFDGIKIITESREFAYILPKLFKKAFDISFDSYPSLASPGKLVFQIWEDDKIQQIMHAFGFSQEDTLSLHVNYPIVEEECCKASFLRGAFWLAAALRTRKRAITWNFPRPTRAWPGKPTFWSGKP